VVPEEGELLLTNLDRAATVLFQISICPFEIGTYTLPYLWNQDLVASLYAHCYSLALLVDTTRSDSQNLGLVQLLDGALWEKDTASGLGLSLDSLDQDTVEKRGEGLDRLDCDAGLELYLALPWDGSEGSRYVSYHCDEGKRVKICLRYVSSLRDKCLDGNVLLEGVLY